MCLCTCSQCNFPVHIITPDNAKDAPDNFLGFPITTIPGYSFSLYKAVTLSFGSSEIGKVIQSFKPDILHVTTPGTLIFRTAFAARKHKIPLVMSYHTHLVHYARTYLPVPGSAWLAQTLVRSMHNLADITLVTSPEMQNELVNIGVRRSAVWDKGVNTEVAITFCIDV